MKYSFSIVGPVERGYSVNFRGLQGQKDESNSQDLEGRWGGGINPSVICLIIPCHIPSMSREESVQGYVVF